MHCIVAQGTNASVLSPDQACATSLRWGSVPVLFVGSVGLRHFSATITRADEMNAMECTWNATRKPQNEQEGRK